MNGCVSTCSAAEASDQPRRYRRDGQLGPPDVEFWQHWPRPVVCRPVPPQVLDRRSLRRDIRRGDDRVHGSRSQRPHCLRVPRRRCQRHWPQSSLHSGRCHHRRAWYVTTPSLMPRLFGLGKSYLRVSQWYILWLELSQNPFLGWSTQLCQ